MQKVFKIEGMHCNSCAQKIEDRLGERVKNISVSYTKGEAKVDFNPEDISEKEIVKVIEEEGYSVGGEKEAPKGVPSDEGKSKKKAPAGVPSALAKGKKGDYVAWGIVIVSAIVLLFFLYQFVEKLDIAIPGAGESSGLLLLFFVGILTGFHCVSMCGAFVVSYTTKNALNGHKSFKQHLVYGGSKVISYSIMGGLFGLIGGIVAFSVGLRGFVAIFAGTFMIFYALSMMGIGFFRRFQFNPKFLTKLTAKASKNAKGPYKGPFVTGILSGLFIACGPLQAMYLYAAGSGNFFTGMSSLFAFGLGTLPVMIGFGSVATVISHKTTRRILKISAIIVLVLGIVMLNRGLTVLGSPVSYDIIKEKIVGVDSGNAVLIDGVQEINMKVDRYGWKPDSFVLKKGIPVRWNIDVEQLTGCNNEIIVRDYNLDIKLKQGMNVVEFTPTKTGTVRWSCWMGMIPGSFIVTESGAASQQELAAGDPGDGGSCGGADGASCGSPTCGSTTGSGGCGCGG